MSHFSEERNYYMRFKSENNIDIIAKKDDEFKKLTTLKITQNKKEKSRSISEKDAIIKKENELLAKKQRAKKAIEIECFSKVLLESMINLSDEDMRDAVSKILLNDSLLREVIKIYAKTPNAISDLSDQSIVVKNALFNVLDIAVTNIEKNHMEFHPIQLAKTISR